MTLRYLSLFSGIGGFDLGFDRAGMECAGQVEIDAKCNEVLAYHWPHVWRHNDVRTLTRKNAPTVDLVCGGFPCQDLSVAGRRKGLAGERSGLWFEFRRVLAGILPEWIVIENVPGLLSSNGGADVQIILDSLTQMGYTVDVDIKDAQEFGVAQRRRRVFLLCVRLDALLSKKTNLSRQIAADLLAQILLNIWAAIPQALSPVQLHWDYVKPIERCAALLQKTTALLRITQERLVCKKYPNNWAVLLAQFGGDGNDLGLGSTSARAGIPPVGSSSLTDMLPSELQAANGGQSMLSLLNQLSAAICEEEKPFTTSTSTNLITDQTIYTFAQTVLLIIGRILHSLDWSDNCWGVAQSASILLTENMNYARQASNFLFIESGLRDSWRAYLRTASRIQEELECHLGNIRASEILFESDSLPGDSPPRREAGERVAESLGGSSQSGGFRTTDLDNNGAFIADTLGTSADRITGRQWALAPLALSLNAHPNRQQADNTNLVAHTLRAEADASEDGTGRGTPLVAAFDWRAGDDSKWHTGPNGQHPGGGAKQIVRQGDYTGALNESRQDAVAGNFGVRRLTPTECERLQGFTSTQKRVIMSVCIDRQKNCVRVEIQSHKSPRPAEIVESARLYLPVSYADESSLASNLLTNRLAQNSVRINCEERTAEIHNPERLLLSANSVGEKEPYPLSMPVENFARVLVGLHTIMGKTTRPGVGESPANDPHLTILPNGNLQLNLYGSETIPLVNYVERYLTENSGVLKSIISNPLNTEISAQTVLTSFCCVARAIVGYIPAETTSADLFQIEILTCFGWTFGMSDSARYRMLGNAVCVPVAEWIGRRIVAQETP